MVRYEEARVKPPWSSGYLYGVFGRAEWNGIWVPAAAAVPLSGDLGAVAALSEKWPVLQLTPALLMAGGPVFISQPAGAPLQRGGGRFVPPSALFLQWPPPDLTVRRRRAILT